MIPIEIMLIMAFTLMASAMYIMWRYFDDRYDVACNLMEAMMRNFANGHDKRIDVLEQKLKDGLQSNAVCCRSAIDKVNSRLSIIEKNQTGSIKVVKQAPKKETK